MPIQYTPNAAGISAAAFLETLENREKTEADLLSQYATNIGFTLSEAQATGTAEYNAGMNNGEQLIAQGAGSIAGASASFGSSLYGASTAQSIVDQGQEEANNLLANSENSMQANFTPELDSELGESTISLNTNEEGVELDVLPNNTNATGSTGASGNHGTEENTATNQPQNTANPTHETNTQNVQANANNPEQPTDTEGSLSSDEAKALDAKKQSIIEQANGAAKMQFEKWSSYSQALSLASTGSGQVAAGIYATEAAEQAKIKDLAQGVSSAANSTANMITSEISSADNAQQSTASIYAAIAQASSSKA